MSKGVMSRKDRIIAASVCGAVLLWSVVVVAVSLSNPPISWDAQAIQGEWLSEGNEVTFRSGQMRHSRAGQSSPYTLNQRDRVIVFMQDGRAVSVPYHFLDKDVLVLNLSGKQVSLIRK